MGSAGSVVADGKRDGRNDEEQDCGKAVDETAGEDEMGAGGEGSFGFCEGLGVVACAIGLGSVEVVEREGIGKVEDDDSGGGIADDGDDDEGVPTDVCGACSDEDGDD